MYFSFAILCTSILHYTVLIYVKWREGINYAISYSEWEQVLGVSHTTAVKILKECSLNGMIVKERGQYYLNSNGETRQETNKYKINTVPDKKPDEEKELNTKVKSWSSKNITSEERDSNWFKTGVESKLEYNDMYIYLTTKCNVLKEHAQKRINGLNNSEGGQNLVESLMKKAKEKLNKETTQIKQNKNMDKVRMQYEIDNMAKDVVYKPKKDTKKKSSLFGDDD